MRSCSICTTNPAADGFDLCASCGGKITVVKAATAEDVRLSARVAYQTSRAMERGQCDRILTPAEAEERRYREAENEAERRAEQCAEARHVGDQAVGWNGQRVVYRSDYR